MTVDNILNLSYKVSFKNDCSVKEYKLKDSRIINQFNISNVRNYCNITFMKFVDFDEPCYEYTLIEIQQSALKISYVVSSSFLDCITQQYLTNAKEMNKTRCEKLIKECSEESKKIGMKVNILKYETSIKLSNLMKTINTQDALKEAGSIINDKLGNVKPLAQYIQESGLSQTQSDLIKTNAAGVSNYQAFLMRNKQTDFSKTYIIGLNKFDIITGLKAALNAKDYTDAYDEFFGDYKARPDFMEKLVCKKQSVLFLVPKDLMNHPNAGETKKEMLWLLNHPSTMKVVNFVFGAYEIVNKTTFSHIPYKEPKSFKYEYRELIIKNVFITMRKATNVMTSDLLQTNNVNASQLVQEVDLLGRKLDKMNLKT